MTRRHRGILLVIAVLALAVPIQAQVLPHVAAGSDAISVSGEAEIRVVPDEVILSLGVETFNLALRPAKTQNDERIRATIAVARRLGVPAERIQTDYVGIEPRHRRSDVTDVLLGFVVRKTVVITLRDISKFEELLSDALEAGVTHVHGVEFRTTELRKHRDQARTLAIKAAQEKANLLATESGRKIGRALSIGEANYGYFSSYGSWWGGGRHSMQTQNVVQNFGGASLGSDATLAPGQISVRVNVGVSYVLD